METQRPNVDCKYCFFLSNEMLYPGELTDEWCEFFRRHHVLVGLSLDGPREMHDLYRVDKGGRGTFDAVVRAARLMKAYRVEFNILTTVHAGNADHPLETYHFLRDEIGARYIQLIPIVEDGNLVTERTVSAEQWGRFLIEMFDEWIRFDVGKVFVQMFDAALASWVGVPAKRDTLPKYCRQCRVRFPCHGECPRNRFIETPDGEPGLEFLCGGYKAFFEHVDRPMRLMADLLRRGRYVDEVMGILAAESRQAVIPA
jgi:uncharacterized protein